MHSQISLGIFTCDEFNSLAFGQSQWLMQNAPIWFKAQTDTFHYLLLTIGQSAKNFRSIFLPSVLKGRKVCSVILQSCLRWSYPGGNGSWCPPAARSPNLHSTSYCGRGSVASSFRISILVISMRLWRQFFNPLGIWRHHCTKWRPRPLPMQNTWKPAEASVPGPLRDNFSEPLLVPRSHQHAQSAETTQSKVQSRRAKTPSPGPVMVVILPNEVLDRVPLSPPISPEFLLVPLSAHLYICPNSRYF